MGKYKPGQHLQETRKMLIEMLSDKRWNDSWQFLSSVHGQLSKRGSLTVRQIEAVEKVYERRN